VKPDEANTAARHADRHSHISIRLRLLHADRWETIEALGWNAVGFNFYSDHEVVGELLSLKRGLIPFEGAIAWTSRQTSDEALRLILVNEFLFQRSKEVAGNHDLHKRLIRLLRAPGMLDQKLSVLATLGQPLSYAHLSTQLAKRRAERPMTHYGVKVESEAWSGIVASALDISSVVKSLEQWSDAFTKL
jgi:hypothetical protein